MTIKERTSKTRFLHICLAVVFSAALSAKLTAQGITSTVPSKSDDPAKTQLAIPGGAGAVVSSSGTAAAGPLIGFQVWQPDRFLVSSFFTFSPPQNLSGTQHDFGSFLLNPPGQGTSFSFAGNKVIPICNGSKILSCDRADGVFFVGVAGRAGLSSTNWQTGSDSTAQSAQGTVAYLTPSFLLTSKTYSFTDSEGGDKNEYQFGFSAGEGLRYITGDLGQSQNDALRKQLLGTTKKNFHGLELEFFVRMNSFKPYFRYSRFLLPNGVSVQGLSNGQVVFGVDVLSSIFQKTLN